MIKKVTEYAVFAKSIGSIITLKNLYENKIKPAKIVICGLPLHIALEDLLIEEYLQSITVPTMFIQNEFDNVASFEEVKNVAEKNVVSRYGLVKVPGIEGHSYREWDLLTREVKRFLGIE